MVCGNHLAKAQTDNIMILEYVDWTSGDGMGVKIYNPTPNPINLTGYTLQIYNNGNLTPNSTVPLTGTMAPGAIFIIGNSSYCNSVCLGTCDQTAGFSGVNDGDVVRIENGGDVIDAVGCLGYSGNVTINGNLINNAYKWIKLVRESDNCIRHTNADGAVPVSWPNNTTANMTGWEVQFVTCIDDSDWAFDAPQTAEDITICAPDSAFIDGNWETESGSYTQVFENVVGCDSLHVINLTVNEAIIQSTIASICTGESYTFGGSQLTLPGTYTDTVSNTGNCPIIEVLELEVLPSFDESQDVQICAGDSVFFDGVWQSEAGTYTSTLQSVSGCDSILTLNLNVGASNNYAVNLSICESDSVLIDGQWINEPGIYEATFEMPNGCDSTVVTTLEVLPVATWEVNTSICEGDSIFVNGSWILEPGSYEVTYEVPNGCDSTVVTNVAVSPSYELQVDTTICGGDSLLLDGIWVSAPGTYSENYTSVSGCDSLITVNVSILENPEPNLQLSICFGDSTLIGGQWRSEAGTFVQTIESGACTFEQTVNLSITEAPVIVNDNVQGCSVVTYNGLNYTESTLVVDTLLSVAGCDSIYLFMQIEVENIELSINAVQAACAGTTVGLSATSEGALTWDNGTEGLNANYLLSESRYITATAQSEDCTFVDSVFVEVLQGPTLSGNTAYTACREVAFQPELLGSDFTEVQWSPGLGLSDPNVLNPEINNNASTTYTVRAQNSCGTDSLQVSVTVEEIQLTTNQDTSICAGDMVWLEAAGADTYSWAPAEWVQDIQSASTIAFPEPSGSGMTQIATFRVTGSRGNCQTTEQVQVTVRQPRLPSDQTINLLQGEVVDLENIYSPNVLVSPQPGSYTVNSDTTIAVILADEMGCSGTTYLNIVPDKVWYAPNAFTPNGDGVNDLWKVVASDIIEVEIRVYDRWGELVFKTDDLNKGWNGGHQFRNDGYYCPADLYNYSLVVILSGNRVSKHRGHITLIR